MAFGDETADISLISWLSLLYLFSSFTKLKTLKTRPKWQLESLGPWGLRSLSLARNTGTGCGIGWPGKGLRGKG